jgi:hypothetical protein
MRRKNREVNIVSECAKIDCQVSNDWIESFRAVVLG